MGVYTFESYILLYYSFSLISTFMLLLNCIEKYKYKQKYHNTKNNYETIEVSADLLGDDVKYLKDGLDVVLAMFEGNAVAMQLPKKIKYTVKEAPPAVKGDSASGNVTKEIVLDNGLIVNAPLFIKEGEEILVNTETGEYGGRVTE